MAQKRRRPGPGGPSAGAASPSDPGLLADIIGKTVFVPSSHFGVEVPDMFYRAKVVGRERGKRGAVTLRFFEDDGSQCWLPAADVARWLRDGGNGDGRCTSSASDTYAAKALSLLRAAASGGGRRPGGQPAPVENPESGKEKEAPGGDPDVPADRDGGPSVAGARGSDAGGAGPRNAAAIGGSDGMRADEALADIREPSFCRAQADGRRSVEHHHPGIQSPGARRAAIGAGSESHPQPVASGAVEVEGVPAMGTGADLRLLPNPTLGLVDGIAVYEQPPTLPVPAVAASAPPDAGRAVGGRCCAAFGMKAPAVETRGAGWESPSFGPIPPCRGAAHRRVGRGGKCTPRRHVGNRDGDVIYIDVDPPGRTSRPPSGDARRLLPGQQHLHQH
ncbi:unnamed protein product, partial [Ostreobium quekettii]